MTIVLTGKHGEINGPGEDAVSSGKGRVSFLLVMALSFPELGLRKGLILLLWVPEEHAPSKPFLMVSLS